MKRCLHPAELLCDIYRLKQYIGIFGQQAAGWTGQVVRLDWTPVYWLINRPGVAWAVLQTALSFIHSLSHQSSFSSKYSEHQKYQTVQARELTFWYNVHLTSGVKCHMSGFMCQLSAVRCDMSHVSVTFFMDKVVKLVGGGSVINRACPV